jgi:hypothetical protein
VLRNSVSKCGAEKALILSTRHQAVRLPVAGGQLPVTGEQLPITGRQLPNTGEQIPNIEIQLPIIDDLLSTAESAEPGFVGAGGFDAEPLPPPPPGDKSPGYQGSAP